jgi:5-methylcytosine-specific restriction endonuclease McrA
MEQTFQHGSYKEKLFDKRWLAKRHIVLERDNRHCSICGSSEKLVVHHKQYHFITKLRKFSEPWDYDDKYLITLCESCHYRGHHKFEVPVKNI